MSKRLPKGPRSDEECGEEFVEWSPEDELKGDRELLDDKSAVARALDLMWEQSDRVTGNVPFEVIEELLFNLVPVIARSTLQNVRVYIILEMQAALEASEFAKATAFNQAHSKLSYQVPAVDRVIIEPEDEDAPPAPPEFIVNQSQAFYVRALMTRGLSAYLNDAKTMREAANSDDCPGVFKVQLNGAANWSQQMLGESIEYIKDLPAEILPEMKDYLQIKPFGPLLHPEGPVSDGA